MKFRATQELQSQDLDTYKDIRNISRNMHKERASQLLPLPTDTEESHESLSAVQLLTNSKDQFLHVNGSKKNTVTFSGKTNLQLLSFIDVPYVDEAFNQHRSFSSNYLQFTNSAMVTTCHLHFFY